MMYVRFPLSLRNVEGLLHERGIEVSHEAARYWWNRFGPMFAGEIRKRRSQQLRQATQWRWHLDEVYVFVSVSQSSSNKLNNMAAVSIAPLNRFTASGLMQ